jgi:hypothetical protein
MKIRPGTLSHLCHCFLFGSMVLSASFSHMVAVCFIRGENRSEGKKNTDLPQVTDKLYRIMLYTSP